MGLGRVEKNADLKTDEMIAAQTMMPPHDQWMVANHSFRLFRGKGARSPHPNRYESPESDR